MAEFYDNKWYAVFGFTGEEDKIRERLLYRFKDDSIKVIVPKRKLIERKNGELQTKIRILFPGYVLLNGDIGTREYYDLKNIPGLIKILKDDNGPTRILENEIAVISKFMHNGEIIESSSVIKKGMGITVIDGPMVGMEGLIDSVDFRKGRAKIRMSFMGEPRVIELAVRLVQPN